MLQPHRLAAAIAGIAMVAASLMVFPTSTGTASADKDIMASGPAIVPFTGIFRRCDHSRTPMHPSGFGTGYAVIGRSGNTVTAEVRIAVARPNTSYVVRLIQMPRPGVGCTAGDPGVAEATMVTDPAGSGSVTVSGSVMAGATGAWAQVLGPFGGNTAAITGEVYSSDYVAGI